MGHMARQPPVSASSRMTDDHSEVACLSLSNLSKICQTLSPQPFSCENCAPKPSQLPDASLLKCTEHQTLMIGMGQ